MSHDEGCAKCQREIERLQPEGDDSPLATAMKIKARTEEWMRSQFPPDENCGACNEAGKACASCAPHIRRCVETATSGLRAEIDDRVRLAKGLLAAKGRADARIAELERDLSYVYTRERHDAELKEERERVLREVRAKVSGAADKTPAQAFYDFRDWLDAALREVEWGDD